MLGRGDSLCLLLGSGDWGSQRVVGPPGRYSTSGECQHSVTLVYKFKLLFAHGIYTSAVCSGCTARDFKIWSSLHHHVLNCLHTLKVSTI